METFASESGLHMFCRPETPPKALLRFPRFRPFCSVHHAFSLHHEEDEDDSIA